MASAPIRNNSLENVDRIWHLKQATLVAEMSAQELEVIDEICSDRIYPRRATIFREGDPIKNLFILNRGYVQVSIGKTDSRRKVLHILKGGEIFGEEILGPHAHHQATATAYEESWVSLLPRQKFLQLVQKRPALSVNFIRILTQRLSEARAELQDLSTLDSQKRVAKTLLKLADLHGRPVIARQHVRKLRIPISHRHLADLIGANRPHISTIMSGFKKQGFVAYEGRKLLLDIEGLRSQLGSQLCRRL